MGFYFLLILTSALLLYRVLRPGKAMEKISLFSLFLFLLLTLAMDPWIKKNWDWLSILEELAVGTSLVWLAGEPVLDWMEKRKRRRRIFSLLRNGRGPIFEIVSACRMLVQAKHGGLIAIERKNPLDPWIQSGVPLDARIRKETIYSIFTPPGALHDGGMIIRGERIAACGVVFPLSKRLDLPTELGTRHRAALGLSEATDALAITISEETGKISLADSGSLLYDVKIERLPEFLETALRNRLVKRKEKRPAGQLVPEPAFR